MEQHGKASGSGKPSGKQRKSCELCRNSKPVAARRITAVVCNKCAVRHSSGGGSGSLSQLPPDGELSDASDDFSLLSEKDEPVDVSVLTTDSDTEQLVGAASQLVARERDKGKLMAVLDILSNRSEPPPRDNVMGKLEQMEGQLNALGTTLTQLSSSMKPTYSSVVGGRGGGVSIGTTRPRPQHTTQPIVKYDPDSTVIIDNVKDKEIAKNSMTLKKALSAHYPLTKFVVAHTTARGKVQIQLQDAETASKMIADWKPEYLGGNTKVKKPSPQLI